MAVPYDIEFSSGAVEQIRSLSSKQHKWIVKLAEALAVNPRPPGANKIIGMTGLYSHTVNELRFIYKIEEQAVLLLFIR